MRVNSFKTAFRLPHCQPLDTKPNGRMCGISVRRYQELEQGHSLPLLSTAVRMAAAFDLSLDSLKGEVK